MATRADLNQGEFENLDAQGSGRGRYIAALIKAVDTGQYVDLVRFARGQTP